MRTARRHDHGQGRRQAAPPAAQAGGAEDRPRPRQHAQQADPPRLDSSPPPPRPADPAHLHPGTASARHDRQQDRPTARHSAHSATTADAPTRRPTTAPRRPGRPQDPPRAALLLYTHQQPQPARTPASGQRWTAGPAARPMRSRPGRPPTVHELNRNRTPRSPRQKSRKNLKIPLDNQENT